MRVEVSVRLRKAALLCVIAAAHLLLFRNMPATNSRGVRNAEEAPGILFFVEIPKPEDSLPTTPASSLRHPSTFDSRLEREATPDNAITLLPGIDESPIDWDAEARRVAGDVARRESAEKEYRSLDRPPPGMGPPPPGSSRHKLGDAQHFEGGVIIDWTSDHCYYENQNYSSPYMSGDAFGPALRLQTPVCKGGGSGGRQMTFEEWKKQRDDPLD